MHPQYFKVLLHSIVKAKSTITMLDPQCPVFQFIYLESNCRIVKYGFQYQLQQEMSQEVCVCVTSPVVRISISRAGLDGDGDEYPRECKKGGQSNYPQAASGHPTRQAAAMDSSVTGQRDLHCTYTAVQ